MREKFFVKELIPLKGVLNRVPRSSAGFKNIQRRSLTTSAARAGTRAVGTGAPPAFKR